MKPTFYWCFGRFAVPPSKFASTTTGPGTGRRSRAYRLSGAPASFPLRTRPDEEDLDGGASTRWLTEGSADRAAPPDLEGYERRRQGRIRTTITGRGTAGGGGGDGDGEDRGIQVRNETIMRVSYSRPKSPDEIDIGMGS